MIQSRSLYVYSIWIALFSCVPASALTAQPHADYREYYQLVNEAEARIVRQEFSEAIILYRQVFKRYEFVFRRDYQVATQLAWQLNRPDEAFSLLRKGIISGWTRKSIRKNKFLKPLQQHEQWKVVDQQYDSLRDISQKRIDAETRDMIQAMFRQDQWKALGALFRFSEKARERYALRKFAPQSERHVAALRQIIQTKGYPGEQLIGNNFWVQTMLSHHNSMTADYTRRDTLYAQLKPALLRAVWAGQMAPAEFALIDDWAISVGRQERSYGYLGALTPADLVRADQRRGEIGLRSVAVRNGLIDVQQQTGMNFYLPGRPQLRGKVRLTDR